MKPRTRKIVETVFWLLFAFFTFYLATLLVVSGLTFPFSTGYPYLTIFAAVLVALGACSLWAAVDTVRS